MFQMKNNEMMLFMYFSFLFPLKKRISNQVIEFFFKKKLNN